MFFKFLPLKESVLRRYRTIYSGAPGRRNGNPGQALRYLFEQTFLRVDGIDISKYTDPQGDTAPAYPNAKEFWLKHDRAALWTDAAIDAYLGDQRPEQDDIKG